MLVSADVLLVERVYVGLLGLVHHDGALEVVVLVLEDARVVDVEVLDDLLALQVLVLALDQKRALDDAQVLRHAQAALLDVDQLRVEREDLRVEENLDLLEHVPLVLEVPDHEEPLVDAWEGGERELYVMRERE